MLDPFGQWGIEPVPSGARRLGFWDYLVLWGDLGIGLGAFSFGVALVLDITRYEGFLLLIGSVFVPLFGVLASDYFAVRRRYEVAEIFRGGGVYWYWNGIHWPGLIAWAAGVGSYLWIAGKLGWLGLSGLPWLGASIPSFLLAFGVYRVLARLVLSSPGAEGSRAS